MSLKSVSQNGVNFGVRVTNSSDSAATLPLIVFEDDNLKVVFYGIRCDYLLVTFAPLKFSHPINIFYAQNFVQRNRIACLGFVSKFENWYPEESMKAAARSCQKILDQYKERIVYGQSMGGYAAVKYSRLLCADTVISFSPQFSIKPLDVPNAGKKFQNYYNKNLHYDMAIKSSDVADRVFLFYDPFERFDLLQAKAIQSVSQSVVHMHAPLTGHLLVTAFADSTSFQTLIDNCRNGDLASLKRLILVRRKASPQRALAAAKHIVERNPLKSHQLFESQKQHSATADTYSFKSSLAKAYFARGDLQRAEESLLEAIAIDSQNADKITLMAEIKQQQGDNEAALNWANKAVAIDKNFGRAHTILQQLKGSGSEILYIGFAF